MSKKMQRIIIIFLVVIMLGSTFGYAISSIVSNTTTTNTTVDDIDNENVTTYAEKLQEVLNQAMKDKNVIKESVLSDLIKRNEAGDYALETTLNILGYPVCVLESYDSQSVIVYSEEKEIKDLLKNISKNNTYTTKSFVQLYWMKENGETIISWVALGEDDMSEVKTVGIITSQYQLLDSLEIPTTEATVETFKDLSLTKEQILETYNPFVYQVQNKLLDCKFITTLMEDEYNYVWTEYVLKTKDGYLFLNTKDDELYLVYENYNDNPDVPEFDKESLANLKENMTIEEFSKILPNLRLAEIYYTNEKTYTVYVGKAKDSEELTYFDFEDGLLMLEDEQSTVSSSVPESSSEIVLESEESLENNIIVNDNF